ncbi:TetR/AcrR family transcriptional regulator [Sphingosinicella sp.]|uniref:TetR/AcrR family transcriptional regulator n=1 Tax=Sphingosinicella sp. TaxID=1917971 RepID=UPI0040376B47
MCARPRRVSDEQIFEAALRAMDRLPPSELTLTAIGDDAGLTASALVQRFGSKRALLLALARSGAEAGPGEAERLLGLHGSPLKAIAAYAECMGQHARSPASFQRGLAYLQQDLADPELRALLARQMDGNRAALVAILSAARNAGELKPQAEPERLAPMIEALIAGGMISWAYRATGSASDIVAVLLRDLLAPYRP